MPYLHCYLFGQGWKQELNLTAPAAGFFPFLVGVPWPATAETLCYGVKTSQASQALVLMFQLEKAMALTEFSKGHFV